MSDLNDLPPLDDSVQRIEIDTYLLAVEQAIERLREAMERFSRFRNYLRSTDKPFTREELENQIDLYERAKQRLST